MKRKLGMMSGCVKAISELDSLKLLKDAGFDAFFSNCYDLCGVAALKEESLRLGLDMEFLHAPFFVTAPDYIHINTFWKADLTFLPLKKAIAAAIDAAANAGISTVVEHVSGGWEAPPLTDLGLSRFDWMVEYALSRNVRIAFENLRNVGNLAALMERYERIPEVGFCYDVGHEHCYTQDVHFLDLFGRRTFCTHIHDNLGRNPKDPQCDMDAHMLPFDGTVDFPDVVSRLDYYGYGGTLMPEVEQASRYADLSPKAFVQLAYHRICQLSALDETASTKSKGAFL